VKKRESAREIRASENYSHQMEARLESTKEGVFVSYYIPVMYLSL